ncbi:uncharacterized protein LOC132746624 [Ruditapes philippinarum]|nr:uncharacterized protein LOC132746624 [Ruditapes philippinarum]
MGSVDIRHAYYSIKIAEEQQKCFCFIWRKQIYQYTCLANGVSEGPRLFTKLLKPVYARLRSLGYVNSGFIDDSFLLGDSYNECEENIKATVNLMLQVGFIINEEKSVLIPTTKLLYLGNIIDSEGMVVTLPKERQDKIVLECQNLCNKSVASIRQVAKVIGLIVASFSAVDYGKLHYRQLELAKTFYLKKNFGNYNAFMPVTDKMRTELTWWVNNLRQQSRSINRSTPNTIIETDASFLGWGAKYKDIRTGGRWLVEEKLLNINVLELLAIFYALRSFREHVVSQHVKIMSDNTTAVSYINNMGGTVSLQCNKIAVEIWTWCIANDIWLTAAHIAGKENLEADQASRKFKDNLEWKLDEKIFNKICDLWVC